MRLRVILKRLKNGMFLSPASLPSTLTMQKNIVKMPQITEATRSSISISNYVKFARSQPILFGKIDILPNLMKTKERWLLSVLVASFSSFPSWFCSLSPPVRRNSSSNSQISHVTQLSRRTVTTSKNTHIKITSLLTTKKIVKDNQLELWNASVKTCQTNSPPAQLPKNNSMQTTVKLNLRMARALPSASGISTKLSGVTISRPPSVWSSLLLTLSFVWSLFP